MIKLNQIARQKWQIQGQVQGVGFRPFVYRLAQKLHLSGHIYNSGNGVSIEAQGTKANLNEFGRSLTNHCPRLARIDTITQDQLDPDEFDTNFDILPSRQDANPNAMVTEDSAVCQDCLRELFETTDQRHHYGLINCTNCGPRYSIATRVPYDRPNTTMVDFEMCPECHKQYSNPENRRFHAQPISCPSCGPQVEIVDSDGRKIEGEPIKIAQQLLLDGNIVAIKGIGGFHLAVRGDNQQAVDRLRQKKHRDQKPFALMCYDIKQAQELVYLTDSSISLLKSSAAPIVLAPKQLKTNIANSVAPNQPRLGMMLPYTPIQHLLFDKEDFPPLVMTSANLSDEPLVKDNSEALERLGNDQLCDAILWHNRDIHRCVDDSVILDMSNGQALPLRRARGYAPQSLKLPFKNAPSGICLGGDLKNSVAIVKNDQVIMSQHLGDLSHPKAFHNFQQTIDDLCRLFGVHPEWIACDIHPGYFSTQFAKELEKKHSIDIVSVQHHHAHAASVMAEHNLKQSVLALICDGTGFGLDGTIWGGELMIANYNYFNRLAYLKPISLIGGDAAAHDIRRTGLSLMYQAYGNLFTHHTNIHEIIPDPKEQYFFATMLKNNTNCVPSSGAGRLFDGIASLLGVCQVNSYEAQAAMQLEALAWQGKHIELIGDNFIPFNEFTKQLDTTSMIRTLLSLKNQGYPNQDLAKWFHDQFVDGWLRVIKYYSEKMDIHTLALSGGVFCNQYITEKLTQQAEQSGLKVLRHHKVPANDGGLAYGQAAIAAAHSKNKFIQKRGNYVFSRTRKVN